MSIFSILKPEKKQKKIFKKDIMLVDYYFSSRATVGGNEHYELVISSVEDKKLVRLDRYIKDREDSAEEKQSFLIPSEAVIKVYRIIKSKRIQKWNELKNGISIDGVTEVLKFWTGEKHIRVSNDNMPKDGQEALREIRGIMQSYLKDEYLIH